MRVPELLFFIYVSASCSAQEALPVPSVHLKSQWSEVFPSEQVTLHCDIKSEDWNILWYRDEQEVHDSSVTLSEENTMLNLKAMSHSQSGQYSCKGQSKTNASVSSARSNAVQIIVQEQKLNPAISIDGNLQNIFVGEPFTLRCSTRESSVWEYVWYQNNIVIHNSSEEVHTVESAAVVQTGNYHCRMKRGGVTVSSNSNTISVRVTDIPIPALKLLSPWSDVVRNEEVSLSCETLGPDWSFNWFKDGQVASSPNIRITDQGGARLRITAVSVSLQGKYTCRAQHNTRHIHSFQSQPVTITVHETPKPTVSKSPPLVSLYIGETVTFSCAVSPSGGWTFKWFRDDVEIGRSDPNLSITLGRSDAGGYSCIAFRGTGGVTHTSDKMTQAVDDVPVPSVKLHSLWSDVFFQEILTLRCEARGTDWKFSWFRNEQPLSEDALLKITAQGSVLHIVSASMSSMGAYSCKAHHKTRTVHSEPSQPLQVKVYENIPKPTLTKAPKYDTMFVGEEVHLRCIIAVASGWTFSWFKDETQVPTTESSVSFQLSLSDAADYSCRGTRGAQTTTESSDKITLAVHEVPVPQLKALTPWLDVFPSEAVVLSCRASSAPHGWTYEWMKDGKNMYFPSHHTLNISSASAAEDGQYKCRAALKGRRVTTSFSTGLTLMVYTEKPQPVLVQIPDYSTLFPQEPLSLRCWINVSSGWHFVWYKNNAQLQSTAEMYEVKSPDATHSGSYSCGARRGQNLGFNTDLSQEKKVEIRNDKPRVTLVQDPNENTFYTEDPVSFSCGVNVSSGWQYSWYKNNDILESGPNHTIRHVYTSHSGDYRCLARRGPKDSAFHTDHSQSAIIQVKERPSASVLLLTGWSEVFSTDSLVLKCEARDTEAQDWEYKWFKGDEKIEQLLSDKHTVTPQNDPDQSQYTCQGVRSGRPSYTKRSQPLKTTNLLLKRRVLLSISGCLVFGLCAVFLGCIILRVFRKPVVDQEKPEEVDLFLTTAELSKHAPNPLAEYITDEDLSGIATKGDDNGTVDCDSALLPRAFEENEATPSESNNGNGNNEMVSFKY